MKITNRLKLGFLFCLGTISCWAQQDSQYTQYMYNTIAVNPAYAGSRGLLSFNSIYRTQWVGLDGAPETISFSMNTPLAFSNLGLGISAFADRIGPVDENNIAMDFSYTINFEEKTKLSFGLKAGINILNIDFEQLEFFNLNDPSFSANVDNRIAPNIGVGFYLHSDRWYVGLSAPNLLETEHFDESNSSIASEKVNFYLIAGYVFDLSQSVKFKPAMLSKVVSGAPIALDLSANFLFYDRFTLGAAYRWDADVSALIGFNISDYIMLGYAYDFDTSALQAFNGGSHEIFLRFEIASRVRRVFNPRFF